MGVVEGCEGGVSRLLLRQRPETGLLAGLWEFPCTLVQPDWSEERKWKELKCWLQLSEDQHRFVGKVRVWEGECERSYNYQLSISIHIQITHLFSHIKHHYHVWHITQKLPSGLLPGNTGCIKWVSCSELKEAAVPTAVRKVCNTHQLKSVCRHEKNPCIIMCVVVLLQLWRQIWSV